MVGASAMHRVGGRVKEHRTENFDYVILSHLKWDRITQSKFTADEVRYSLEHTEEHKLVLPYSLLPLCFFWRLWKRT